MANEDLRESLLKAYEIIRNHTEMISDLMNLLTPLMESLQPKYQRLTPMEAFLQCQEESLPEAVRLKRDSLAVVDDAIRRLKGD